MNSYRVATSLIIIVLFMAGCSRSQVEARAASASIPRDGNYVPAGTVIKVRTASLISSRAVAPGERIEVELAEPLEVEGRTRIPAGAAAVLSVVDSKPGVPLGSGSRLLLKVTQLRRSLVDRVEVNTAGLQREGPEIAPGSVLTFKLATPAQLETKRAK
jgi:hypothetical protein